MTAEYTKMHEGKNYVLTPEKSIYYTQSIFGYTRFLTPEMVSVKVKTEKASDSIYFIADIESDLGNLYDRTVFFEKTEKGTQVFVTIEGSTVSAPIGFVFA
jgi:hypothetical protein